MDKLTLTFSHEKDTKGTRKYTEDERPGQAPVIGSLYVKKHVQPPDKIQLTIEPAPSS